MAMTEAQSALLDMYQERVTALIEKARKSRAMGKIALADRQLEQCVEVYREYALSQVDVLFKVSYLIGTAVKFAVLMGMHEKANQVMTEAERLCPTSDAELIASVKKVRIEVDNAKKQKYHPQGKRQW